MYNDFARIYDKLQSIDYSKFIEYYDRIFQKYNIKPDIILDLGCGTGNITIPLAKKGYSMIGIDLSVEMLNQAKTKADTEDLDILFLNQDMCEFELYGTVDVIISALDSINYITDESDIKKVFNLVCNYLNPGGFMIFDINTPYKLEKVLGENTFIDEENDIFYTWQNYFDKDEQICGFDLNFFEKKDDGSYNRFEEYHEEKAYRKEELRKYAEEAELEFIGCFDEFSFEEATENNERNFIILKKK